MSGRQVRNNYNDDDGDGDEDTGYRGKYFLVSRVIHWDMYVTIQ